MNSNLVMSPDEIVERHEKAEDVRYCGVPSGKLPPTAYQLRIKEVKEEANNQMDLDEFILRETEQKTGNHEIGTFEDDASMLIDFILGDENDQLITLK